MSRVLILAGLVLLAALVVVLTFHRAQTDLLHVMGVEPRMPSTTYNFWSGIGSDIGEVTIIGALILLYHHHECHIGTCHRLHWKSWTDPDGHVHALCKKHHPHKQPTEAELAALVAREQNPVAPLS
jgi:hypothetical protein